MLGRSLDELPPQTRRLLMLIDGRVGAEAGRQAIRRADVRFTRRALREAIAWGDTQLRLQLERLVDLEHVLAHREGPGGKFVHELAYEVGGDARAQIAGLIDIATLQTLAATPTTGKSRGADPEVVGGLRADSGPVAGRSRGRQSPAKPQGAGVSGDGIDDDATPRVHKANGKTSS